MLSLRTFVTFAILEQYRFAVSAEINILRSGRIEHYLSTAFSWHAIKLHKERSVGKANGSVYILTRCSEKNLFIIIAKGIGNIFGRMMSQTLCRASIGIH